MQIVEAGKISSIYDNINLYLNETDMVAWGFPQGTTAYCPTIYGQSQTICQQGINMTFASMMSMQSGIIAAITCSYTSSDWEYQYCVPPTIPMRYGGSIANTISSFIQNPLWTQPRTTYNIVDQSNMYSSSNTNSYEYANENFIILAYIVEKLSGLSYRQYIKQHIIDVVKMENTFYDPYSQEFLMKPNLANEYFFYTDLPFPASEDPDTSSGAYPPFAIGGCAQVEYDPGYQSGSGGIISTVPDMVKWYTSLFIKRNTTVLTSASVDLLIYPWAITDNFPQYYGFATELMFTTPYWSSPDVNPKENISSIYYMGGSMCTFFTIVIWNSTYPSFGGPESITLPTVTAVARNNRILNVTESTWSSAQDTRVGTWNTITQNGDIYFQALGWSDPACCGTFGSSLTDTEIVAFDLAWYMSSYAFEGAPSAMPTAMPVIDNSSSGDDDFGPLTVSMGVAAFVLLFFGILGGVALVVYLFYYFYVRKGYFGGPNLDKQATGLLLGSTGHQL